MLILAAAALGAAGLVGVAALRRPASSPAADPGPQAPPPEQEHEATPAEPPPSDAGARMPEPPALDLGGLDLGSAGGAAAGAAMFAALGAAAGGILQDQLDSSNEHKTTGALAPVVGGIVMAGSYLLLGSVMAGPPGMIIVLPALVVISAVLGTMNAIEGAQQYARRAELTQKINELISKGDEWAAWYTAVDAFHEGYTGLGWRGNKPAPTFYAKDGTEFNTQEALDWAYGGPHALDDGSGAVIPAQEFGDRIAEEIEAAQPWLWKGSCRRILAPPTPEQRAEMERLKAEARADMGLPPLPPPEHSYYAPIPPAAVQQATASLPLSTIGFVPARVGDEGAGLSIGGIIPPQPRVPPPPPPRIPLYKLGLGDE